MTTIEVPISLIKAGDMDAIRELLPKENLFGRWATHPTLGRGIIISAYTEVDGSIQFSYKKEQSIVGTCWDWIPLNSLTLDPVELTTLEDFEDAPEGTVIAKPLTSACQKVCAERWESVDELFTNRELALSGPWTILRWGWGE